MSRLSPLDSQAVVYATWPTALFDGRLGNHFHIKLYPHDGRGHSGSSGWTKFSYQALHPRRPGKWTLSYMEEVPQYNHAGKSNGAIEETATKKGCIWRSQYGLFCWMKRKKAIRLTYEGHLAIHPVVNRTAKLGRKAKIRSFRPMGQWIRWVDNVGTAMIGMYNAYSTRPSTKFSAPI